MNTMGYLCREVYEDSALTQRQLAQNLGISLGKCNSLVREALELGYIETSGGSIAITGDGLAYLEQYRVKNAVVHASSIDVRFVRYYRDRPKALLEVENERIVERIIRQLREKGIVDITLIVGYLAEKMEYLADKYNVKLVFNQHYATQSNLAGVYATRHEMHNTYLITADFWMCENLFHEFEPESWICCYQHQGMTDEWCLTVDGKRRVRSMRQGGLDMLVKRGPVYIDTKTATQLIPVIEDAYAMPGMPVLRWEYTLEQHLDELPLYGNIQPAEMVKDFGSMEELREFDVQRSETHMEGNLQEIARIFETRRENIRHVEWMEVSAANRIFRFTVGEETYVCRLPHSATARFVTYRQEGLVYKALQPLHVTEEVVYFDMESGLKLSRYFPVANYIAEEGLPALRGVMQLMRRIHQSGIKVRHNFNVGQTLHQYDILCRRENCVRFEDYETIWHALEGPLEVIDEAGDEMVLCHINAEMYDVIDAPDGGLRLANWEYSGMCHPLADVAMTALFFDCGPDKLATLLEWYLERPATGWEYTLCRCYAAAGGILWSLYGEHCQYEGDDFGAYALRMYRLGKRYLRELGHLPPL